MVNVETRGDGIKQMDMFLFSARPAVSYLQSLLQRNLSCSVIKAHVSLKC